jgi:glycosyltransferase involved in cell wall biosynthesis
MITIAIRTFNEEENIAQCLRAACQSFDDVVVIDQESTDRTLELCKHFPVRILNTNKFHSESEQLQWIAQHAPAPNEWIYFCDADEIIPPDLGAEIKSAVAEAKPDVVAFALRYKNYFCGRWIKHCGIYPVWVTRLFKVGHVRWERVTNTRAVVDGRAEYLNGHFEHYSFRKGIENWVAKHNLYSTGEAIEEAKASINMSGSALVRDSVRRLRLRHERRQALKQLATLAPFRPMLRFIYMYVLKRGFLDGLAGFHYCMLLAFYEYMITLKRREISSPPFGR